MESGNDELLARAQARLGTVLKGKYRLESLLGVGGMATVFAAVHERNGRAVAIKILHPELSLRADLRSRFLKEGLAANAVQHDGAVAVLDDDTAEDGSAFIVMERLRGSSLEELWEENGGRLPLPIVVSVGIQLLDVLASAHAHGIIHRDIKPANLFLTRKGELRVLDFGIARVRDAVSSSHATQTGMMMGTPAFMAPEQARGKTSQVDAQTDIWAVGATLFTLASGERVHEAENAQELLVVAATTPARSLRSVLPSAPDAIADVVDRALAFDKSKRWASAAAMRDALKVAAKDALGEGASLHSLASFIAAQEKTEVRSAPTPGEGVPAAEPSGPTGTLPVQSAGTAGKRPDERGPWPLQPLIGTTTAQPVSTSPPTLPKKLVAATRARPEVFIPLLALGGVAVIGVVVTALVFGLRRTPGASARASASASQVDSSVITVAAPPSGIPTGAPTESTVTFDDLPKPSAMVSAKAMPEPPRPPTALAPSGQPPVTVPPPPPAAKKNCDPPYTIDPTGKKVFRVECL